MKITELENIKGYTLIEVMIAMLITFIVMGGAYQTMTRETIDMERQEIILDMQNNARVAIDRITRDIRQAGFFGCGGKPSANTTGVAFPPDPIVFTAGATDAITVAFLVGDVPLEPGHDDTTSTVTTKELQLNRAAFAEGDILLITDCQAYSVFQKTNCSDTKLVKHTADDDCGSGSTVINNTDDLGRAYGAVEQARVYRLNTSSFFVSGLDLKHNLANRTIASNIEDLQFEFKYDKDNDGKLDDEKWQQTFTDPEDVRAIRVWVLARSEEMSDYTNGETYDYPNSSYYSSLNPYESTNGAGGAPNDNRYRYLTSSAVYLRNAGTI